MSNPTQSKPGGPTPAPAVVPKKSQTTRVVVFSIVGVITLLGLISIASWGGYRLRHTVVNNATVKGRVHKIGARIDGQIQSVEVQPGERVARGQVLIRLVDDQFQAALREARAELVSAQKRVAAERLAIEHERRRLAVEVERCEALSKSLSGTHAAASSTRDKWDIEFERVMVLIQSNVASPSERDAIRAERDSARATVDATAASLAAAQSDCRLALLQIEALRVREANLEVLGAEEELARQRVATREADLAATVIRAPEDGWVASRIVEAGGSAKIGEPMMSVWFGAPWVEAWVDERKLANITIGSAVDVKLIAFSDFKLAGRVEAIGVLADKELQETAVPASVRSFFTDHAMVPIRIAVPGDEVRLQPGLTALVGIRDAAQPETRQAKIKAENFLAVIPLVQPENK
jgi:membrane fusion protein (multidrug efflux system)